MSDTESDAPTAINVTVTPTPAITSDLQRSYWLAIKARMERAEARVTELEASWVPPERVEEIAALARQLGEALKRETAKQYREYQYVQVRDALDAYREALGSGKLRIVRAE